MIVGQAIVTSHNDDFSCCCCGSGWELTVAGCGEVSISEETKTLSCDGLSLTEGSIYPVDGYSAVLGEKSQPK